MAREDPLLVVDFAVIRRSAVVTLATAGQIEDIVISLSYFKNPMKRRNTLHGIFYYKNEKIKKLISDFVLVN